MIRKALLLAAMLLSGLAIMAAAFTLILPTQYNNVIKVSMEDKILTSVKNSTQSNITIDDMQKFCKQEINPEYAELCSGIKNGKIATQGGLKNAVAELFVEQNIYPLIDESFGGFTPSGAIAVMYAVAAYIFYIIAAWLNVSEKPKAIFVIWFMCLILLYLASNSVLSSIGGKMQNTPEVNAIIVSGMAKALDLALVISGIALVIPLLAVYAVQKRMIHI